MKYLENFEKTNDEETNRILNRLNESMQKEYENLSPMLTHSNIIKKTHHHQFDVITTTVLSDSINNIFELNPAITSSHKLVHLTEIVTRLSLKISDIPSSMQNFCSSATLSLYIESNKHLPPALFYVGTQFTTRIPGYAEQFFVQTKSDEVELRGYWAVRPVTK
jgi:hypothetical protein